MQPALTFVIIVVSLALTGCILIQAKGVGLGRSLGSSAYHSRRGLERILFKATIVLAVLFALISIANQFVLK